MDPSEYARLYRSLLRIRRVEEEIARVYLTDKIKSPVHLAIGQEAVSVGVCEALTPEDVVFGTYRSHAVYLAKGGDLKRMIAELYGKATGCAKGKGGSMHLIDAAAGVMGTSAVVGTTIPQAVGYAWGVKRGGARTVVVSLFGDAALEEGVSHESMNFAALKKLPVIFVCENNFYSIHSPLSARQPHANIWERAAAYGIPAERIADNDVLRIHARVKEAAAAIRGGYAGPWFFECLTYRWKEHVGPNDDFHAGYRSRTEAEPWFERDQVKRLAELVSADARREIEHEVLAEIRDAFQFAEDSPFPETRELYTDVFTETEHGAPAVVR